MEFLRLRPDAAPAARGVSTNRRWWQLGPPDPIHFGRQQLNRPVCAVRRKVRPLPVEVQDVVSVGEQMLIHDS